MANIVPIQKPETLEETRERMNRQFTELDTDIKTHKSSNQAHDAESIVYEGEVTAPNVKQAIDALNLQIASIVSQSGEDITEIVDARHDTTTGTTFTSLGERLNALAYYLNFMPINGGEFDGNDPVGPTIDGGTY